MKNHGFISISTLLNSGILFILLFGYSCSSRNSKNIGNEFLVIKELEGETLIKSEKLKDPWDLCLKDTFLLIGNLKGDPQLEIFGISGGFLKRTLPIGKGPAEILGIGLIQSNYDDDLFYIYDLLGRKILEYNIKYLLKDEKYAPGIYLNLSSNNKFKSDINKVIIAKDYLICDNRTPDGRILLMSKEGTPIKYCLKYPGKVSPKISDFDNATLFGSMLTVNPKKDRLAIATSMASIIDIFKLKSESIDSIWAFHESLPNDIYIMSLGDGYSQAFFTKKSKLGYLDIASSKKYVYALYSGLSSEDENKGFGNIIRVISWDGDERFEIRTDRWLSRIDVDVNDDYLYGVSTNAGTGPEIVKFKL